MEKKRKTSYRSYVLAAKTDKGIVEIDWTAIQRFKEFKKEKYKLERIDFFTRHYVNNVELINELISSGIIHEEDMTGARLWIYPAKQNKVTEIIDGKKKSISKPLYAPEHLQYGLAYKSYTPLFDDLYIVYLLQSKLSDFEFITKLFNKYGVQGNYSERNCENLRAKINSTQLAIANARTPNERENYERILKSYWKQYHDITEMYGLLISIRAYSMSVNNGEYQDNEAIESARNNIREFFLREKYDVIKCHDGLNDNRRLEFAKDKDGNTKINYLAYHNFIMFIGSLLGDELKPKEITTPPVEKVKKLRKKDIPIEGQLSLFDLLD